MSEAPARHHLIGLVDGAPRILADDPWVTVAPGSEAATSTLAGHHLYPLAHLLERSDEVSRSGQPIGVSLAPNDEPESLRQLLPHLAVIGVQFPKFTDGRGYSLAYLVRRRLGWSGQLRAQGDVLQDQLFALRRVGFDAFELRGDRDPQAALAGFGVFTRSYQGSVDNDLPAFRRPGATA
jgi:uncharacterized protein (DUF934 family)